MNPHGKIAATSCSEALKTLRALADPAALTGMARFGIHTDKALGGISAPALKKVARSIGRNHNLAQELWKSGLHEARQLAFLIDETDKVTERQMERWTKDFNSWDIVDGCCLYLFAGTPYAHQKAMEWSNRREEFVKRAAFTLMAVLAVHDKSAGDQEFIRFLPIIRRESTDGRNFVKKSVNWALRQIGKRNARLNRAAIKVGRQIREIDSPTARWIAADALRELKSEPVQKRLQRRQISRYSRQGSKK